MAQDDFQEQVLADEAPAYDAVQHTDAEDPAPAEDVVAAEQDVDAVDPLDNEVELVVTEAFADVENLRVSVGSTTVEVDGPSVTVTEREARELEQSPALERAE